jgi:hypothetical protein
MTRFLARSLAFAVFAALVGAWAEAASADDKVVVPFNGRNLDGWKPQGDAAHSAWTVGHATLNPQNPKELVVAPSEGSSGELINARAHSVDFYTVEKFGDAKFEMELMVPQGSNSGIYPLGEYEVQILDSYGHKTVNKGDLGAVYGVAAPRVNAARKPGQWQQIVIDFRAPRFEDGKKVANARFVKVTLNGQVIQENVEVRGPTGGGMTGEAPTGPLKLQGNHGAVAFRNIRITVP